MCLTLDQGHFCHWKRPRVTKLFLLFMGLVAGGGLDLLAIACNCLI